MKKLFLFLIILSFVALPSVTFAEVNQVSDAEKLESIRLGIDINVIDGMNYNTLNLSSTEAVMYLVIDSESNFEYFKSLNDSEKLDIMNSVVQDNFGYVLGVSYCYTIVVYNEKAYALTTTT